MAAVVWAPGAAAISATADSSSRRALRGCERVRNDKAYFLRNFDREVVRAIEADLNLRQAFYYEVGLS